jgi:molybdate transport system ATP-binding protein
LNGRVLFDVEQGRGHRLPPYSRGVSLLAQQALLFPHLSVRDNVAFGPRCRGMPHRAARDRAMRWLDEVDAVELADRKPAELSGGQAQRVAVARALAADPELLLLDEPMAALDVSVAPLLRRMLRRVLADRTVLLVTHEILDAYSLADRVVIIEDGALVDSGPVRQVLEHPRTVFAARLVGTNLITGTATAEGLKPGEGFKPVEGLKREGGLKVGTGDRIRARDAGEVPLGGAAAVTFPPRAVRVQLTASAEHPDDRLRSGSAVNLVPVVVRDLEPREEWVRIHGDDLVADVDPARVAALDLTPGTRAWFVFDADDVTLYAL